MPYQPAVLGSARLNNFRLNYLTADQAGDRPFYVRVILGGVDITQPAAPTRVLYKSLTIRDLVFDQPNTCSLTLYGAAPHVGQRLEVWINSDAPVLLFGGELQTVDRSYRGRPSTVIHPCTAIDDTAAANRKQPLMRFVNVSATTIAQTLITTYCPGFSAAGVELGLPPVTVNFDGSEGGLKGCLTQVAKLIGGYWYFENKTLYLFVTPPGPSPDPIDMTPGRFLHDPPIAWSIDKSQVRTRVYGKGASTQITTNLNATTDLVPVDEATMFNAAGGQAIAAMTPDGAASKVVTYTGVQLGGGGGLVGPGAAPSSAPGLALATGAGMESGVHSYAITFTTAAGESLPSPASSITVGLVANPATAPTPGAPTAGGSIDPGTYQYGVTFVTASGETMGGPGSASVVTQANVGGRTVAPPPTALTATQMPSASGATDQWSPGDSITYRLVYVNAQGVTTAGPASSNFIALQAAGYPAGLCRLVDLSNMPVSADPSVSQKRYYRYRNNVSQGYATIPNSWQTDTQEGSALTAGAPPGTNTATVPGVHYQTVTLTQIPIGPALVTARRIYRGPSWKLVDTIANNTATTYTDTKAEASLTTAAPVVNTATANRVTVGLPLGGASVVDRKVYRTAANVATLQLVFTVGNNVATSFLDTAADATLGAAPPAADTSGLTQPSGQVLAGATAMIVANAAPFSAAGGWAVVGNGDQVIRYSTKTATSLTGIPPAGPGALVASVSYNSTITAAPALVGVIGLLDTLQGSPIHVWVQRDDAAAQAHMITLDGGGDGVYEHIVSDERRSEASLIQVCDAELALYGRPLVTVTYASRDLKTKSGKTVSIAITSPAITESLTIQDVTIDEIAIARRLAPKFTVTASSVHHTFEAILQKLIRKAGA